MFDPLAFLKPGKAASMEGLVSRDMFEKFAADDEERYNYIASGGALDDDPLSDSVQRRKRAMALEQIKGHMEQVARYLENNESVQISIFNSNFSYSHRRVGSTGMNTNEPVFLSYTNYIVLAPNDMHILAYEIASHLEKTYAERIKFSIKIQDDSISEWISCTPIQE